MFVRLRRLGWLALPAALSMAMPAAAAAPVAPVAAAETREPRPAIWLLSDADTRIYLFGTIHILHPDLRWRSAALERVVGEADELVLELDDAEMARSGPELLGPMDLGKSVPIAERVSPERREPLSRMIAELGLPANGFDRMQTWAAAVILGVAGMVREYSADSGAGLEQAARALPGVEEVLTADFRARGRPISGVERSEDQIGVFRAMPLPVQRAMLEDLVDSYAAGEAAGDPDESAWVSGNIEGIAAELEEMPPELYDALVTRRNRNWTDWLIARLDRPGTVLFAVGAGHLAGRVSVQSMLATRGFTVTRLN